MEVVPALQALVAWGPIGALLVIVWLHGQERRQDRELRSKEAQAMAASSVELARNLGNLSTAVQEFRASLPHACRAVPFRAHE